MNKIVIEKIQKVRVLVMDVDGVLTDGKIIIDAGGNEIKNFDVQDGFGIVFFKRAGYKTAVISARAAEAVSVRLKDLKVDKIYQDAYPKVNAYVKLLNDLRVTEGQVCFIGDDLPDLGVLKRVGFAVAVANAVDEVKKAADYVTKKNGGEGAVREVIELILKTQGKWESIVASI